jgi:PAS domain-containing protein
MITLDELHKRSQDLDMAGAWLAIQRDLLSRLAAAATLNEALALCLEAATQAARMERGRLYVFDGPGGSLKLVAHQNLPDDLREAVKVLPADSPIAQGLNITAPIYQPHVYTQWDLTGGDAELRSAAIVPVFHQKQRAAILHLGTAHHDQVQKYAAIPLESIAQIIGGLLGQFQSRAELKSLKSHAQSQLEQTRSLADTILEQTDAFAYTQLQQLTAQFTQSLAELKSQQESELARLRHEAQSRLANRHTAQAEHQTELKTISIQTQAALKQLENNLRARLDSLHNESSQTLAQTEAAMQTGWQDAQSQLTLMLMEIKTRTEADVRQLTRQAQENRAHHQAKYQHLLNSVSDWVWAVAPEGIFTASNPAIPPCWAIAPAR